MRNTGPAYQLLSLQTDRRAERVVFQFPMGGCQCRQTRQRSPFRQEWCARRRLALERPERTSGNRQPLSSGKSALLPLHVFRPSQCQCRHCIALYPGILGESQNGFSPVDTITQRRNGNKTRKLRLQHQTTQMSRRQRVWLKESTGVSLCTQITIELPTCVTLLWDLVYTKSRISKLCFAKRKLR